MDEKSSDLRKHVSNAITRKALDALMPFIMTIFDESDRGAVLVAQSCLDGLLGDIFASIFTQNAEVLSQKELKAELGWLLKGSLAPLGGYYRRVQMAHALGLIGRDAKQILEDINSMRINSAHSSSFIKFDHAALDRLTTKNDGKYGVSISVLIQALWTSTKETHEEWQARHFNQSLNSRLQFVACLIPVFIDLKYLSLRIECVGWPGGWPKTGEAESRAKARAFWERIKRQDADTGPAQPHEEPPPIAPAT